MTKHVTVMTIDDAEHYTEAERAAIIAGYPEHEREARAKGVPTMGSGRVFPVSEDKIKIDPFELPDHWARINGLDFGWDHPFGAVQLVHDRDSDCIYVVKTYRERESTPVIHSAAIKPWGEWVPCAWPHDGMQHDKGSGNQLAILYKEQGLNMLADHATHEEGGYGVEAGVMDMLDRMQTGRLKVFSNLADWFEEFRLYHRKNGIIVKLRDDLMSATRIGLMMLREAKTRPKPRKINYGKLGSIA